MMMMVDSAMESVHVPMVLSPSPSKLNGSVHHRHALNVSTLSGASFKHGLERPSESKAGGTSNLVDPSFALSVTAAGDSLQESIAISSSPTHRRNNSRGGGGIAAGIAVNKFLMLLALLSVVSVLLAFLAIVFFLKMTPAIDLRADVDRFLSTDECRLVYEVVLGLIVFTVALDFSCFLICAAQFLFAAKLLKVAHGEERVVRYLHCSSCSRSFAVCGFFISVPVFITGMILYTFIHFQSTSAIIAGSVLGGGILISGVAIVHNAHLWQREHSRPLDRSKTSAANLSIARDGSSGTNQDPAALTQMELSTLV